MLFRSGLLLDPNYYVRLIPSDKTQLDLVEGAFGFDLGIAKMRSNLLPTKVVGCVYEKEALGIAYSIPSANFDGYEGVKAEVITDPQSRISVLMTSHTDATTRAKVFNFELNIGFEVLVPERVKSLVALAADKPEA